MTVRRASRLVGESCPCVFVGTLNFGGLLHCDLLIYGVSLYEEGMKTARCFRVLAGIGIFPWHSHRVCALGLHLIHGLKEARRSYLRHVVAHKDGYGQGPLAYSFREIFSMAKYSFSDRRHSL